MNTKILRKKWGISFKLLALFIAYLYFFVGGFFLGGIGKHEIKPVNTECSYDIIQACHVSLPQNAEIISISSHSLMGNIHYILIKMKGIDDPYELIELNKNNYIKEYEDLCGDKMNVINNIRRLDKFSVYPNTRYLPKSASITVLYDDDYVYLSIDSIHMYSKAVSKVFNEYYDKK